MHYLINTKNSCKDVTPAKFKEFLENDRTISCKMCPIKLEAGLQVCYNAAIKSAAIELLSHYETDAKLQLL